MCERAYEMWECMSNCVSGGGGGAGAIHCIKLKVCRDIGLSATDFEGQAQAMTQCIYMKKRHFEGQSTCTFCAVAFECLCTGAYLGDPEPSLFPQPLSNQYQQFSCTICPDRVLISL